METCLSWWSVGILHHGSTLVTHALIYCYTYILKNMCMSVFPTHTTIITHKEQLENDVSVWNSNSMSCFHADILFYNRICCFKLAYTSYVMRLCWCCCHIHLSFDVNVICGTTRTRVFGRLWFGSTRMHQFFYTCVVLYTHTCLTLNTYVFFCYIGFHLISQLLLHNLRLCYIVAVIVSSFSKIMHYRTHASFRIHTYVWVFAHMCEL
jgi:hypothetical protein